MAEANEATNEPLSLVANAVGGDRIALQQLLLGYYPIIVTSVRAKFEKQLAGFLDVDDIVQEALVKVHRSIGSYRQLEHGTFEAWLRTIAGNCVVDATRRSGRQKRSGKVQAVTRRPESATESLDTIFDWVCDDSSLPERSVRRAEARRAIHVCLSELPAARTRSGPGPLF